MIDNKDEKHTMGQEAEAKFRSLFQHAAEGLLVVNQQGIITEANHRAELIFGFQERELEQQPLNLLIPRRFHETHDKHREVYRQGPRHRPMGRGFELLGVKKDGTEFPVEVSLSHVQTERDMLVMAHISDISHRKLLEKQLAHSQKMESLGMLASGITHDFNNILSVVQTCGEILRSKLNANDPLYRFVEQICAAGKKGEGLIQQVMAFVRKQPGKPQLVHPGELLQQLGEMLNTLVGSRIKLVVDLAEEIPFILVDPTQFEQIVVNLVVNARDAIERHGEIDVAAAGLALQAPLNISSGQLPIGDYLVITVRDNGCGMSPDVLHKIFDPFFTTKPAEKGTGLGLSTVYGIVHQYSGGIEVSSSVGDGSAFAIYLPAAESSEVSEFTP